MGHPHLNLLVCSDKDLQIDVGKYRSPNGKQSNTNEQIIKEWKAITGDSYIHNIRKIDVKDNYFNRSGIGEVFKYAIKFSSLDVEQLAEIVELQEKRKYRFYDTYGIFRRMGSGTSKSFDDTNSRQDAFHYVNQTYQEIVV